MKNLNLDSKKGSLQDLIYIMLVIGLFGGLIVLFGWKAVTTMTPVADQILNAEGQSALDQIEGFNKVLDTAFIVVFIGLMLVAIIFSYFIKTHPVFMVLTFILDGIIVIISYISSQVYSSIAELSEFATEAAAFPMMNWLLTNFAIVMLAFIAIQAIVMYGAIRNEV